MGERVRIFSDGNQSVRPGLHKLILKQAVPLALSIGLFVLLRDAAGRLDFAAIIGGMAQVSPLAWVGAACLSAVSFWAVGRYDRVVHGMCGTGITGAEATRAGATAIAVAQTVGFGVVSGAIVRWRLLPGLSFLAALRLSFAVSLSFLAGWAVITALAVILLPVTLPFPASRALAWAVLGVATLLAAFNLWRPAFLTRLRLPPMRAMGLILMLVLLDTSMAGAALYVLLPAGVDISLARFLTAFLFALGAGLLLGTPGGVGPFEVLLLGLLPEVEQASLLGAVLAFRLIYYALPALLGAALAIRGTSATADTSTPDILPAPQGQSLETLIETTPEAEAGLLRHGRFALLAGGAMVAPLGQSLILMRAGLRADMPAPSLIATLERAAQRRFLAPALYKAPARLAVAARRAGWQVLPIARDAWLNPQTWAPEGRAFRQLRRKLRKAEAAGVTITRPRTLPLRDMQRISDAWVARRGGERGFSMGVFDPTSIGENSVWLAHREGRLVGFLSLMGNRHSQVLDLMRYADDAADGSMHLALVTAIADARARGQTRLSLAALPCPTADGPMAHLSTRLDQISGAAGLAQFKQSFAPQWQTLYMAAPTRFALAVAGLEICREILRKPVPNRCSPQVQHVGFEFAPAADPWQQAHK